KKPDDLARVVNASKICRECARDVESRETAAGIHEAMGSGKPSHNLSCTVDAQGKRLPCAGHVDRRESGGLRMCHRTGSEQSRSNKSSASEESREHTVAVTHDKNPLSCLEKATYRKWAKRSAKNGLPVNSSCRATFQGGFPQTAKDRPLPF